MASYRVALTTSAQKELSKLSNLIIARVVPKLENLAINPRPVRSKKLKGGDSEWRIRVGDYRVVYTIDDIHRVVEVTRIAHRKDVYQP